MEILCKRTILQLLPVVASLILVQGTANRFQVLENSPTNHIVGTVTVNQTSSRNFRFEDSSTDFRAECNTYFNIGTESGTITVANQSTLDREAIFEPHQNDVLTCRVAYSQNTAATIDIEIEILDVNDNDPFFFGLEQRINISENVAENTVLEYLQPLDRDKGQNGKTEVTITGGNNDGFFEIRIPHEQTVNSTMNRDLFLVKELNFEEVPSINLTLTVTDMGEPPRLHSQQLFIQVINLMDEPPTFETSNYFFNVTENAPAGTYIGSVLAGTYQGLDNIMYQICCGPSSEVINHIELNSSSGELHLKQPIDYESGLTQLRFHVSAANPTTRSVKDTTVAIDVINVNEYSPHVECFQRNSNLSCTHNINGSEYYIVEGFYDTKSLLSLDVEDNDSQPEFRARKRPIQPEITPSDSNISTTLIQPEFLTDIDIITILLSGNLDRERTPAITAVIPLENIADPPLPSETIITFTILDINDNAPSFSQQTYETSIFEGSPMGMEIMEVAASDPDKDENGTVTYTIEEEVNWFQVSPETGVVNVTAPNIQHLAVNGSVTLTITARDNGTHPLSSSATVVISILPSTTFISGSYLEFSNNDFNFVGAEGLYLEFRTQERRGMLVYQRDLSGTEFTVKVAEGVVVVTLGENEVRGREEVADDDWHALHIERGGQQGDQGMSVTVFDLTDSRRVDIFQEMEQQRCVNISSQEDRASGHPNSLYIGGVNVFLFPSESFEERTLHFHGAIRSVMVGGVQVDPACSVADVNTIKGAGVVRHQDRCVAMSCSKNRTYQCVNYAPEPYCRCRGGFSPTICNLSGEEQERQSYAPIRFKGYNMVNINLGYSFFYDTVVQSATSVSMGGVETGAGNGGEDQAPERRRRREVGGAEQVVEVTFRMAEVRSGILLSSQTSLSSHLIRVEHNEDEGTTTVKYTIWDADMARIINLSVGNIKLESREEYTLRASTGQSGATLTINGNTEQQLWETTPPAQFAEQPQTVVSIGGAPGPQINATDPNFRFFMGCIIHLSINGIELPLNGLLTAGSGSGGFEVEGETSNGVENLCNLCELTVCPSNANCVSNGYGGVVCSCKDNLTLANNGESCVSPTTLPTPGLTQSFQMTLVYYIAGGTGGAVVLILLLVIIIIAVSTKRRRLRRKTTYNINSSSMTGFGSNSLRSNSLRSNHYTDFKGEFKRHNSSASASNVACSSVDNHGEFRLERRSSVSTYQEHDIGPDAESPTHHPTPRRSMESGIKADMDDQEVVLGVPPSKVGVRGIPHMEDSGHEVNSTDSARSVESEEIASSGTEQHMPSTPRAGVSLRLMGPLSSPDEHSYVSRSPHTPLTPKEKKVMIPLRPDSTNLSQSEYGDEATDTESFNTRVSSSSGVGASSMQNQGRGSDSEKSGCTTPQWYKSSTTSDTERENMRILATRPYYPQPNIRSLPNHTPDGAPAARGNSMRGNPRNNYSMMMHQPHPPTYYSPPTFTEHMNGGFPRQRSKSMHTSSTQSPLAKSPRKYENFFTGNGGGMENGRMGSYEMRRPPNPYNNVTPPTRPRHMSDSRVLDEDEEEPGYTPSTTSFTRQYSDPRIPHNGTYCIPRKAATGASNDLAPIHARQMSDPRVSSQQTQDSILVQPRSSQSMRQVNSPPSVYANKRPAHHHALNHRNPLNYATLGARRNLPDYSANQAGRSFSTGNAASGGAGRQQGEGGEEPFQTLEHLSRIDPISNWDAQDRMKTAVDHMDPYQFFSGPCMQFEDVSTDPSVIESQLTMDESIVADQQVFESQGGGEGTADMLDPLDMRLTRLREDEIDSIMTDSEVSKHEINHFPSADCSSQYTGTIVAGSTSTSGESTPKLQNVFVMPPSQQSFDV